MLFIFRFCASVQAKNIPVGGFFFFVSNPALAVFCLDVMFLVLLVPYIRHYFGLENGVQRLYDLYAQLEKL